MPLQTHFCLGGPRHCPHKGPGCLCFQLLLEMFNGDIHGKSRDITERLSEKPSFIVMIFLFNPERGFLKLMPISQGSSLGICLEK